MAKLSTIALFDVDGTLTVPRNAADPATLSFLQELRKFVKVGIVGGSDLVKIQEQLGQKASSEYDYCFSENGLVAHQEAYDEKAGVRKAFVEVLKREFADLPLCYSIGGQISFDVFPKGWDKTYCLRFLDDKFKTIHFFGDKTFQGGNDYEIYESPRTIGHAVTSPFDTISQCRKLFMEPSDIA
ncbi:hypothetical protein WJX84_008741 [Apatococcus fuscideae]|uniref:Phosphomannomutase n=1 Tax=Apatococcus fuscideae TaxID=2026836 RepID=A0AAW1SQX6_9CHLO